MANKKVSELNAASALNGSEVTHGVQSGGDVKISATQILTYVGANLTKNNVGLANVDNTSDESKPLSLATQTELDKKQNIIQFIDIDALNNAILSSPVWIEGQLISVASEPPGVKRIWNGIDALTATIQNGSIIYLNNTSNTISNTTGIPNNAVGIDGDVRIDVTNNLYYQKANGLWSSGIALFPGGELYPYRAPTTVPPFSINILQTLLKTYRPCVVDNPYSAIGPQIVHPTLERLYGFKGYEWALAYTPYANQSSNYENPCIVVSNDLINWVVPTGHANPIIDKPASGYNADPNLFMDTANKRLLLVYRQRIGTVNSLIILSTTDFITWTPTTIWTGSGTSDDMASPSLMYDYQANIWRIIAHNVDGTAPFPVREMHTSGTDPLTGWTSPATITFATPESGRQWWHSDIKLLRSGQYVGMAMDDASPTPAMNVGELYYLQSSDGVTFAKSRSVLRKSYKPAIYPLSEDEVIVVHGKYAAGGALEIFTGKTNAFSELTLWKRMVLDWLTGTGPVLVYDTFNRADNATTLGTSDSGHTYTISGGPLGISSNQAYAPTTASGYIITSTVNHRVGAIISGYNAAAFVAARIVDANNYIRAGMNAPTDTALKFQVVTAGSLAVNISVETAKITAAPLFVELECNGPLISLFLGGECIYSYTDITKLSGKGVGFRLTSGSPSALLDSFWAVGI